MSIDIIIFAIIAAVIIHRLRSVLGTRHGDERQRANPFAETPAYQKPDVMPHPVHRPARAKPIDWEESRALIDVAPQDHAAGEELKTRLSELAAADAGFDIEGFVSGARMAFEMIVTSYAKGDRAALKPLLSEKLYEDFAGGIKSREQAGRTTSIEIHRIKSARIVDARLAGVMAYVTIDFDVEETTVTRDAAGQVIEGDPERLTEVTDIWTFARDIRSDDPNWILIETSTKDQ